MSNSHSEKFLSKLLIGFVFITAAILSILYASFEKSATDDWYLWGIVASLAFNLGLYFLLEAFVHKVKSDLIKRQKHRDQQKAYS
jgi:hypothetical protein